MSICTTALFFLPSCMWFASEVFPVVGQGHCQHVSIRDGILRGVIEEDVCAFRGIPYAAPPTHDLRWKEPELPIPWRGVRNASNYGNMCVQTNGLGDEDCLFVNVHTPARQCSSAAKMPVLVYIHGGLYQDGSSNLFSGVKLVSYSIQSDKPVVVVTFNYRLNVFGFLGSPSLQNLRGNGAVGNYGFQDQRLAMRWVRRNIAAFGGDPHRVMLFGQSAGAGSVSCHLASKHSRGLFSTVALESGSFSSWVAHPLAFTESVYHQVLEKTGCADSTCLRSLSTAALVAVLPQVVSAANNVYLVWAPTIDGVELERHPWDSAQHGLLIKVPILHGTNLDDAVPFVPLPTLLTTEGFIAVFTQTFGVVMGPSAAEAASALYLGPGEVHPEVPFLSDGWWSAVRAVTDQMFFCPASNSSAVLTMRGFRVFQYIFSHVVDALKSTRPYVKHSDEIPYVWQSPGSFPVPPNLVYPPSPEEVALSKQIATFWFRHAAFGDPNGLVESKWPAYTSPGALIFLDTDTNGGIHAMYGAYRAAKCKFMSEWLARTLAM